MASNTLPPGVSGPKPSSRAGGGGGVRSTDPATPTVVDSLLRSPTSSPVDSADSPGNHIHTPDGSPSLFTDSPGADAIFADGVRRRQGKQDSACCDSCDPVWSLRWQRFKAAVTRVKSVDMIRAELAGDGAAFVAPAKQESGYVDVESSKHEEQTATFGPSDGTDGPDVVQKLPRVLSVLDLITYGIGSTVGAGVFVITGVAASKTAGPSLVLSFLVAAVACLFSGLCYCEFATRVPGSAYTYAYATLGELIGFFIGWNLTLEYGISASAVARGWAGYLAAAFDSFGAPLPHWMYKWEIDGLPGNFSPLAVLVIVGCTCLLVVGVKQSATVNKFMTCLNIAIILFVVGYGATFVDTSNWSPFTPFGINGIFKGAAKVFFSYIGFDTVSGLAEEVANPQRDLPIGIAGTLGVAGMLYMAVSLVVTGMVVYPDLDPNAPLSKAFTFHHIHWAADLVAIGSVTTLTSTTLCSLLGQPRIYMRMSQDGLFFKPFGRIHPKYQTPVFGTVFTGILSSIIAFFLDIEVLADMISIGTLLAFNMVCAGVLVLRFKTNQEEESARGLHLTALVVIGGFFSGLLYMLGLPDYIYLTAGGLLCVVPLFPMFFIPQLARAPGSTHFQTPLVPLVPWCGILVNTYLLFQLDALSLVRLVVWTFIGLTIYFGYGIRHSLMAESNAKSKPMHSSYASTAGS